MSDCGFKTAAPEISPLDPHKRVNYFAGLVLGPDEFKQDQLYMMERDRLHQRSLHGYGTVIGLAVQERAGSDGRPEVVVAPGLAVTPRGESVCVPQAQCAKLDEWLEEHADDLPTISSSPGSPDSQLTLWVTLCARECETDPVPVLGDPCRTAEDATAPSRIADDFELKLVTEPPEQQEEEAVRLFGSLLRAIEVTDNPASGTYLGPDDLAVLVMRLIPSGSPPELPTLDELLEIGATGGSPSASPSGPAEPLLLHPDDLEAALLAAWRAWVAEVRPRLAGGAAGCPDNGPNCVRLARLDFSISDTGNGPQVDGPVMVDDENRPWLLHTRLLQEWLMGGSTAAQAPGSPAIGSPPVGSPPVGSPPIGSPPVGSPPMGSPPVGSPPNVPFFPSPFLHADLSGLDANDHPHYLLVDDNTQALINDLDADGHRIVGLGEAVAPDPGDAVRWNRAVKVDDAAGGDLSGLYPNPQVAQLQGNPVSNAPPATNQFLRWNGAVWAPANIPPPSAPDTLEAGLVRIVALSWGHEDNSHLLQLIHDGNPVSGLALAFGTEGSPEEAVIAATLTTRTVLLWARSAVGTSPFFQHLEVRSTIVPARVVAVNSQRRIVETDTAATATVDSVVILLESDLAKRIVEQRLELRVEARGSFIIDRENRAIDAEFNRAQLPTGDRPSAARLGIQGGRFESFITAGRLTIDGIDINSANVGRLTGIDGIGNVLARGIIETRERIGGFNDIDELALVSGISQNMIDRLRELMDG